VGAPKWDVMPTAISFNEEIPRHER
jgi:hypothetical protein